ncbi:hypothetical protein K1T71_008958 [Dendrolimus kikuchii]|uniref:Uncharacterized protein n=1 Tax=Dendrolimus kikuchii TaxID=765133 RepID=A0ACC1CVR0_9NEOP|nr:hypothetical protein K1T71_008958 [Dendrolimus kikuchii]
MASSSEESFAWTNASSDSSEDKMAQSDMDGDQPDDDSEYGRHYKKKLHKEIFSDSQNRVEVPKKASKRRITFVPSDSDENVAAPKKKIKLEPKSDNESQKKKNRSVDTNQDTSDEERYLNVKVKEELVLAGSMTKNNHNEDKELEGDIKKETEKEIKKLNNVDEDTELKEYKKKKKKSKKKRNLSETSAMSIDQNEPILNNTTMISLEHSKDEISIIEKVIPTQNGIAHTDSILISNKDTKRNKNNVSVSQDINTNSNTSQIITEKSIHTSRKISERLMVEEDDLEPSRYNKDEGVTSSRLKKYLKTNSHLKPISASIQSHQEITDEDEIWLIKCPSELESSSFQNKKLTLEGKFKIKMDGHTYEGNTTTVDDRVAMMSITNNQFVISSLPLAGVIHLQRRIPKPRLQESNIIDNNLSDFIPLPETKRRHPLFGANFKTCIKVPTEIAEKLRSTQGIDLNVKKKKKRNKKEKIISEERDDGTALELKEEEQEVSSRKKKKRKNKSEEEEIPHKKIKHNMKHNFISPEAWDSEKAIEENLFNF